MKAYKVTVNGNVYEITLEVIDKADIKTPAAPVAAPAPAAPAAAGATTITAPMPGTILKVNVAVGQKVAKDTVLCILEAMKMENEILAPADGTVSQVLVSNGTNVDTGAPLIVLA